MQAHRMVMGDKVPKFTVCLIHDVENKMTEIELLYVWVTDILWMHRKQNCWLLYISISLIEVRESKADKNQSGSKVDST